MPARVLFSPDGQRPANFPANEAERSEVVKLVVGTLPGNDDKKAASAATLESVQEWLNLSNLGTDFPHLTHLHLWRLHGMKHLSGLPHGLKCLDVRYAVDLEAVEELPGALETLDLGYCPNLTTVAAPLQKTISWLHLDECNRLSSFQALQLLTGSAELREFTASGYTNLTELHLPKNPDRLQKLVLGGCAKLFRLPDLSSCHNLYHLNLNGCKTLASLPPISASAGQRGLGYLLTHGCTNLRQFGRLDIRPIHLSDDEEENVAPDFRTMQRLCDDTTRLVMAKILLLGSGRCGKTTIAKALQWNELPGAARRVNRECEDPDDRLDPSENQNSTHSIKFWEWPTAFSFPKDRNEPGHVHIWDFAGQEIYHNTHRLFASQGSVFLIATTSPENHESRLNKELDDLGPVQKAEHRAQNEYREIKYWFDYIRNALNLNEIDDLAKSRGKVSIKVIHTGSGTAGYLAEQAGGYANLLENGEIEVHSVDFHSANWESSFKKIDHWVKQELGKAADRFGIIVPRFYGDLANWCSSEIKEDNDTILSHDEWETVAADHAPPLPEDPMVAASFRRDQGLATARYLHHCGRVFWLRPKFGKSHVIVNQKWSIRRLYTIADRNSPTVGQLRKIAGKLITEEILLAALMRSPEFKQLDDGQRIHFLNLLDQCNVIVRTPQGRWMVAQAEILPTKKAAASEWQSFWEGFRASHPDMVTHSFALHGEQGGLLGNSDYREVLAAAIRGLSNDLPESILPKPDGIDDTLKPGILREARPWHTNGRELETDCRFWANGFVCSVSRRETNDAFLLQAEWVPCVKDSGQASFDGGLFIQILAPEADENGYSDRLKNWLTGKGGPLEIFLNKLSESDHRPPDLSREVLSLPRGFGQPGWFRTNGPERPSARFDIAISYRSPQQPLVDLMCGSFLKAGLPEPYRYSDDLRLNESKNRTGGSFITEIYDFLLQAKVLIIIASPDYFEKPDYEMKRNLYCPVELAEAIVAWKKAGPYQRPAENLFWVFERIPDGPSNSNFEPMLTETLRAYATEVCGHPNRKPKDPLSDDRSQIDRREEDSIKFCQRDVLGEFKSKFCRAAKQSFVYDAAAADPFTMMIERIRERLARNI